LARVRYQLLVAGLGLLLRRLCKTAAFTTANTLSAHHHHTNHHRCQTTTSTSTTTTALDMRLRRAAHNNGATLDRTPLVPLSIVATRLPMIGQV
jgi:hypothetical protein